LPPAETDPVLVTLGYEKRTLDEFLELLREAGVERLVDVRQNAFSRKPGFTKKFLTKALEHAGIEYVHMPMLGCTRPMRKALREGGPVDAYLQDYARHLDAETEAIDRLERLARERPTAVMCMERSLERCHRTVLAKHLEAAGLSLRHL
jgi:uncharacterized protein (DUF488 family)